MQPEDPANQLGTNKQHYTTIFDLARPTWPANDVVTPAISERRVRKLERGNDEEKLMAAFARHVINPGRNNRTGSKWVSRRSLRKSFPEHFGHTGFFAHSSWKDKRAADFGLPDLFLRSVDFNRACLAPLESVDDLVEDLGQAPNLQSSTEEEHQQLRDRIVHDEHGEPLTNSQPQSPVNSSQRVQDSQDQAAPDMTRDGNTVPRPSKRLRSMSSAKSQSEDKTGTHSLLGTDWVKSDRMSPPGTTQRESPEIKHSTTSPRRGLGTLDTRNRENNNNAHAASQQRLDQRLPARSRISHKHEHEPLQQQQTNVPTSQDQSKADQSVGPPAANNIRAVKAILTPKICDLLKDFPTAHEDKFFSPLLHQLIRAAVANIPQAIEERHLDLYTHVVTNCTSTSPIDQVETASLVRPVLKNLSRHRHKMGSQTHSQIQRDINAAARANNVDWRRASQADLLLHEAQHEEEQSGQ
ncbi:hypothetical protein QM012_005931 [Aureobasidium pullulans]|uniref:Uncharacterized protein n=1 Tax=Aureobasidium pullulans TaxID=5580 RepID=A0ABR0TR56_AURPU